MNAIVLVDNHGHGSLGGEHGLSLFITYHQHHILLDAGKSSLFIENAERLGIDLKIVEAAVLSHAHYDHSNGMDAFLCLNKQAPLYVQRSVQPNCYRTLNGHFQKYIGIPSGLLKDHADRIHRVDQREKILDGVTLLQHTLKDLKETGRRENMVVKTKDGYQDDDFLHEQSLVFKTDMGLVVFNSCCHAGADRIVQEVQEAFPDSVLHTLIGGFHLKNKTDEEVLTFAKRLNAVGLKQIYTGHCTGDRAFTILQETLDCPIQQFFSGKNLSLPED